MIPMIDHAFGAEPLTDEDYRHLPGVLRRMVVRQSDVARHRQEQILAVYRERAREARPWPTVREVCEKVGLLSSSTVQSHQNVLIQHAALVQHHATGSRTIMLPREWWRPEPQGEPCGECGRW